MKSQVPKAAIIFAEVADASKATTDGGGQGNQADSAAGGYGRKSMKRTLTLILAALVAAALFGGLVHAVLVAAHVSEPAATTVYGLTPRRLWATTVAVLALVGAVIGGLGLARPTSRFGAASGRLGAIVALAAGLIAVINGVLVLAIANGGPGSGNGVVGGAGALLLGLIAVALGGLALAVVCRGRRHSQGARTRSVESDSADQNLEPKAAGHYGGPRRRIAEIRTVGGRSSGG